MRKKPKKIIFSLVTALLLAQFSVFASALDFCRGANGVSSAYAASEYYKKLSAVTLTGDGRTDVIAVALSQLGYTESNSLSDLSGSASGSGNYTEYNYNMGSFGLGYGGSGYPWCASFVSFCLLQSGCTDQTSTADWCRSHEGDSRYIWREVSCSRWARQLRLCGFFRNSVAYGGNYAPISGDLIFFTDVGGHETHIGLVLSCDGEYVYTVEGNTSDSAGLDVNGGGVYLKKYPVSSAYIRGYGVLPYEVVTPPQNVLNSLEVSGVTISPAFDPEVTEYFATVPNEIETLDILASAPDGVTVTVDSSALEAGDVTEVRVIVDGGAGEARAYILRVMREAAEELPEVDSEPPESALPEIAPPAEDEVDINGEEATPKTEAEESTESQSEAQESESKKETQAVSEEEQGCMSSIDVTMAIVVICVAFCIAWVGERFAF